MENLKSTMKYWILSLKYPEKIYRFMVKASESQVISCALISTILNLDGKLYGLFKNYDKEEFIGFEANFEEAKVHFLQLTTIETNREVCGKFYFGVSHEFLK